MKRKREKQIVVITGCTSGIGEALCKLYRADGDTVIGLSRSAEGGDMRVDVTSQSALRAAIDSIGNKYGHIDTIIACAGAGLSGATELIPLEKIQEQFDLNFFGALETVRLSLKYMSGGAKVVFVSSACALFALPYRAMYCASKSAVNMAAFGLYMELKQCGIKVSSICPGDIKTNFTANRVKCESDGGRYGDAPKDAANRLDQRENKRMKLDKSAKKIYRYCKKCSKPLYIIGAKYKFLNFLRHVLPQKLFLDCTAKLFD